jgi:hypothetical protein
MISRPLLRVLLGTLSTSPLIAATPTPHNPPSPSPFHWLDTRYLLAFGDSYTYAQGTLGYPNSSFIGSALPGNYSYTPQQVLSSRIIQDPVHAVGTANRGPNWIEYLTDCGTRIGLTDPQTCRVQLWDFAFGGADVSQEYLPQHHNWSVQLVNQTAEFLRYAEPTLRGVVGVTPEKTVVAFWIGINDIGDSAKKAVDFPTYYNELITTMFTQAVSPIYSAGYRHFLFMNLPPLNRTPPNLVRAAGPLPNATMIGWWNGALESHVEQFGKEKGDATAWLFDANTFLNGVLDRGEEYGFGNTTGLCPGADMPLPVEQYGCGDLWEYFWFDSGHM